MTMAGRVVAVAVVVSRLASDAAGSVAVTGIQPVILVLVPAAR